MISAFCRKNVYCKYNRKQEDKKTRRIQTDGPTDRETDRWKDNSQTDNRQAGRQKDRETDRQTDRLVDRQNIRLTNSKRANR